MHKQHKTKRKKITKDSHSSAQNQIREKKEAPSTGTSIINEVCLWLPDSIFMDLSRA